MKKLSITSLPVLFIAILLISTLGAAAPQQDLTKADWSVSAARNLASTPPELNAVEDFTSRAVGESEENPPVDVCEFRFADLRNSGNLSLIVSVAPGSWGCTALFIFDRTPKGFEAYRANARGHDLDHSVLDLNHDGRHQLALWADLGGYATGTAFGQLGCEAKWPLIFAWTGNTYSDVSDQHKDYYPGYLQSVNSRLGAYSVALVPASAPSANLPPMRNSVSVLGQTEAETVSLPQVASIAPTTPGAAPTPKAAASIPDWAARNLGQQDYPCTWIEAAKTEAFLGIDSASTINAAIKDSESDDPDKRIAAAVIFSFLGTQEAKQDLKTLTDDADPRVAAIAKTAASFGEDPPLFARTMSREDTYIKLTGPPQSKP